MCRPRSSARYRRRDRHQFLARLERDHGHAAHGRIDLGAIGEGQTWIALT